MSDARLDEIDRWYGAGGSYAGAPTKQELCGALIELVEEVRRQRRDKAAAALERKEVLEAAIQAKLAEFDTGHGVLTDWLVIAAQQNFEDDGTPTTSVAVLLPTESFPHYRILGLLRHATVRYEADLTNCGLEEI